MSLFPTDDYLEIRTAWQERDPSLKNSHRLFRAAIHVPSVVPWCKSATHPGSEEMSFLFIGGERVFLYRKSKLDRIYRSSMKSCPLYRFMSIDVDVLIEAAALYHLAHSNNPLLGAQPVAEKHHGY